MGSFLQKYQAYLKSYFTFYLLVDLLLGIILALQKCERVNVYEYIPSVRESSRCHYYGLKNETNPSCTYGSWHPVSAEKLFFLALTDSSDKQIFMDGVLSIPGVSKVKC